MHRGEGLISATAFSIEWMDLHPVQQISTLSDELTRALRSAFSSAEYNPCFQRERCDLQQGVQLLERFVEYDRIRIRQPHKNLQIQFTRPLASGNAFVAYTDAIGHLDGQRCLLEWKSTSCRYPDEPTGLLMLDPQLVCYSWMTGIADGTQVVFVRNVLSRSNTSGPPSPSSREPSSASWSTTRSVGSNRASFCLIAASDSHRINALAARS